MDAQSPALKTLVSPLLADSLNLASPSTHAGTPLSLAAQSVQERVAAAEATPMQNISQEEVAPILALRQPARAGEEGSQEEARAGSPVIHANLEGLTTSIRSQSSTNILALGPPPRLKSPIVYSRRRLSSGARSKTKSRAATSEVELPASTEVAPLDHFINKITKTIDTLLPVPKINKRRRKAPPSGELTWRSRRITGLGAEPGYAAPSQSKRKVMHSLGFEFSQEQLSQQHQDDYAKLFAHPLSVVHVQALAALFGWSILESFRGEEPCVGTS
jgi:hypothetical protein